MNENERPKEHCAVCGREILPGQRSEKRYDGKTVHRECAEAVYAECDDCGMWFPKSAMREAVGHPVCKLCLKERYERCCECGELVRNEDTTYVDSVDGYVCDSCLREYFSRCECCEGYFRNDSMRETVSGDYVCESCYDDNYVTCDDCGYAVHVNDSVDRCGRHYCESCDSRVNDASDGVMGYHCFDENRYVPRMCEGEWSERLFFGVELECERGDFDIGDFSYWTGDSEENPLVHFEEDGSLGSDGVEAITQPCTLRYHQTSLGWKDLCGTLADQGFVSHNTSSCGLHVHISRAALRPTTIVKMDVFVNRAKDFFSVIARRESFYGCGGKYERQKKADKRKADVFGPHSGRYTAVNTTNERTVEVRIFRGTLRHETILGTIEMLHGLVKFLDNLPIVKIYETEANVMKFIDYLAENHGKYPHVLPMMRRLFVEPRSHRKDYAKRIGKWYGQLVERTADENEI